MGSPAAMGRQQREGASLAGDGWSFVYGGAVGTAGPPPESAHQLAQNTAHWQPL